MGWISRSPDISYINCDVPKEFDLVIPFHFVRLKSYYWEFLEDPGRCGVLYHEPAKCYTRITNSWLLFLEAPQGPEGPVSLAREEYRPVVLTHWSLLLSKCVPGDQDLICRLHDFTLAKARKEDVKRVIAWLKVSYPSVLLVIFICACCRWAQVYRKISSFAGKLMALKGIHCQCVVEYGTCCLGRATGGGDGGGKCDGVHEERVAIVIDWKAVTSVRAPGYINYNAVRTLFYWLIVLVMTHFPSWTGNTLRFPQRSLCSLTRGKFIYRFSPTLALPVCT